MRKVRATVVSSVALAGLVWVGGHAQAQESPTTKTLEYTCDPTTGEYTVTATVAINIDSGAYVTGGYVYTRASGGVGGTSLSFDPSDVDPFGTTTATVTVPGDTVGFEAIIGVELEKTVDDGTVSTELPGDCTAPVTTTAAPTTTTRVAVEAVAVQPSFTG